MVGRGFGHFTRCLVLITLKVLPYHRADIFQIQHGTDWFGPYDNSKILSESILPHYSKCLLGDSRTLALADTLCHLAIAQGEVPMHLVVWARQYIARNGWIIKKKFI